MDQEENFMSSNQSWKEKANLEKISLIRFFSVTYASIVLPFAQLASVLTDFGKLFVLRFENEVSYQLQHNSY